jgi:hypothetical protein
VNLPSKIELVITFHKDECCVHNCLNAVCNRYFFCDENTIISVNTTCRIYSKMFAHFIAFLADYSLDFTKVNMLITCQLLRSRCPHRRQHGKNAATNARVLGS